MLVIFYLRGAYIIRYDTSEKHEKYTLAWPDIGIAEKLQSIKNY